MAAANGQSNGSPDETKKAQEKLMTSYDGVPPVSNTTDGPASKCVPPCRFIFAFMGFFCFFNLYSLRVNLSVAIVTMVNVTFMKQLAAENALLSNSSSVLEDTCDMGTDVNQTVIPPKDGPFNWDSKQQGFLLGALFYGYIVTQLPGGMLAEKFGGKLVLLVGIAVTAILTIITPIVSEVGGFAGLFAIRFLEGLAEGVAFPAMHVMLSNWAPPLERGRMATFVYAGAQMGTVITMPVSGVLCQLYSWHSVFYLFGAIGLVWSVMWIFLVFDKPSAHPRISPKERHYIESSQGPHRAKGPEMKIPWCEMAKSPAVYALMAGNFAHNWGNFFMITVIPQFLSYILKFNIQSSGAVAGAPYLTMWFGMLLGGTITDFILSRHLMSVTYVRKLFVVIGLGLPAVCFVGIGYVNCATGAAVALLIIIGFLIGLSWGGWGVNHLDIAPPFAGTLFGITNCISTIPGFAAPPIVGALTYRNQTQAAWRSAFYITAGVLIFGAAVFIIFGTGQRQRWSIPQTKGEEVEDPVPLKGGADKTDEELEDAKEDATDDAREMNSV